MPEGITDSFRLQTACFPGLKGALHLSIFSPASGFGRCWVVHVPAFAEEMNKSRAMVAAQARALANLGITVVIPDLYGTGDSEGDFVEARWALWKTDLIEITRWARTCGATHLTMWGHRLGALLAMEVAAAMPEAPDQMMLWQPVHAGKQHMTQFLRLRMAASLAAGEAGKEKVSALREALQSGSSLRVAGYELSGELFAEIERSHIGEIPLPRATSIIVLEVVGNASALASPVNQKLVSQWQDGERDCQLVTACGDSFWATQELATVADLVHKSTAAVGSYYGLACSDILLSRVGLSDETLPGLLSISDSAVRPLTFLCGNAQLAGVLHLPEQRTADTAVLIVVGGPQYRIGSHRQFVSLAAALSSAGYPTLRFDYRGMGDSDGILKGFANVDDDIRAAIDSLIKQCPGVTKVLLWGLCDAATAAVIYGASDRRVAGLLLANPWIYSEQGSAKAYLKHYYLRRVFSRSFWSKVFSGSIHLGKSLASLKHFARLAVGGEAATPSTSPSPGKPSFTDDLASSFALYLKRFQGPVLLILSGNDLTAAEFRDAGRSHSGLRGQLRKARVEVVNLQEVDHTFSRPEWRRKVEAETVDFIARRFG